MGLVYSTRTEPGRRRQENQDAVHAAPLSAGDGPGVERHLLAVADGVGGRDRGGWASRTCVSVVAGSLPTLLGVHEPGLALRQAVAAANCTVWEAEASRGSDDRSAASTLVAVLAEPGRLWWANVGDSRAYLVRGGRGRQLTRDHSWVAQQVAAGQLSVQDARRHPRRHVLQRALGVQSDVEVDVGGPVPLAPLDTIVLCSDGVHGPIADEEIVGLAAQGSVEQAAARLVALSNERGGPDNISVIVCRVTPA